MSFNKQLMTDKIWCVDKQKILDNSGTRTKGCLLPASWYAYTICASALGPAFLNVLARYETQSL